MVPLCAQAEGWGGGSRDFSASHSSKHDINNSDYFRLPSVKIWNSLAAPAEASLGRVAPGVLCWGAQPWLAAGHCALRQAARSGNTLLFFPLLMLPIILWAIWG